MKDDGTTKIIPCGCGDYPISHERGPCIINGCECPGYKPWTEMPEWWQRERQTVRPSDRMVTARNRGTAFGCTCSEWSTCADHYAQGR